MSRFEIRLPHRSRGDHLSTAGGLARLLSGDDAAVARAIALRGLLEGRETIGEQLDYLEALDAPARRAVLDEARTAAGLESATAIEQRESFEAVQAEMRSRPYTNAAGERLASCAAESCSAIPQDGHGAWRLVPDRRWWCGEHEHLRGEHDHLPPEPNFKIDPATMALVPIGDALAREQTHAARVQREAELKAAERREEAATRERARAERRAPAPRPAGFG